MKHQTPIYLAVLLSLTILGVAAQEKRDATSAAELKIVTAADTLWADGPASLPAGAKMAVIDGDPRKGGPFTIRLKMPSGYRIPPHTHPTPERITVISGVVRLGLGEKFDDAAGRVMKAGDFAVVPSGVAHFAWSEGEAVIQIHSEGPFQRKFVDPADDSSQTKK
jgi:hypothetical protein